MWNWKGAIWKFLRTICNKNLEDFVNHTKLLELVQGKDIAIHSVEALIRKKRLAYFNQILKMDDLAYFNQILKMDDSRLVKQVIFSDALEGRRKSGRPLLSWRHSIAQDMKFFGLQDIMSRDDYSRVLGKLSLAKPFQMQTNIESTRKITKNCKTQGL